MVFSACALFLLPPSSSSPSVLTFYSSHFYFGFLYSSFPHPLPHFYRHYLLISLQFFRCLFRFSLMHNDSFSFHIAISLISFPPPPVGQFSFELQRLQSDCHISKTWPLNCRLHTMRHSKSLSAGTKIGCRKEIINAATCVTPQFDGTSCGLRDNLLASSH